MTRLDFSQPPFDVLSASERQSLKKHTQVRYLAKDAALSVTDMSYFYVVLKGHVQQYLDDTYVGDFCASDVSNDWFDARRSPYSGTPEQLTGLLQRADTDLSPCLNRSGSNSYRYVALEDSLLLQIEATAIDRLSAQNHHIRQLLSGELSERMRMLVNRRSHQHGMLPSYASFANHTTAAQDTAQDVSALSANQSIAGNKTGHTVHADHLVDQPLADALSQQQLQPPLNLQQAETQQLMLQPITIIPLLPLHVVDEEDSLMTAASTMTKAGLKHVLIKRAPSPERHPTRGQDSQMGILTDADICRAVSDGVDMTTTACRHYAKFRLRTIACHQDISEALLTMIRYRVHRLPVVDENDEFIGVLGQSGLFFVIQGAA